MIARLVPFYSYRRDDVLKALPGTKEEALAHPADIEAQVRLAGLLFDLGEKNESLKILDRVLISQGGMCRTHTFRGLILLGRGETENAATSFQEAMRICTGAGRTEALLGSAGVHLARNEIEKAAMLLEEATLTDPSATVGVVMAKFRAFQGEFTKALDICTTYASRYPRDERFPAMAADFFLSLDEFSQAKELIDSALRTNPSSSWASTIAP